MQIINLTDLLLHLANLILLYFVLRFLVYKPVKKFMDKRAATYQEQQEAYESAKQQAQVLEAEGEASLAAARKKSAELLQQAEAIAKQQAQQTVGEARQQAEEIISRAQRESEQHRKQAYRELQEDLSDLAVDIASRVVERNVAMDDDERLIDDFLKKAEL